MNVLGAVLLLIVLVGAFLVGTRGLWGDERRLVIYAFAAHIVGTFALVYYHVNMFRGGDLLFYQVLGQQLSHYAELDFARNLPDVVKFTLQLPNELPGQWAFEGNSSATIAGFNAFLYFFFGDSYYATSLPVSLFAFIGCAELYRVVREFVKPDERRAVAIGILLVPSVVFWSSGVVKEAFALGGIGISCAGFYNILKQRRFVPGALAVVVGWGVLALVKPYILIPFVLALAAFIFVARGKRISTLQKVGAVLFAAAGIVALTRLFPRFGVDHVAESIATSRQNYAYAAQGSGIDVGVTDDESLTGQFVYAPLALLNALARPFLTDIRNPAMAVAAFEMTALVVILVGLVWRFKVRRVVREVMMSPLLTASTVFVLTFGISVGLATVNLGTLSRYRLPMMPLYVSGMLLLRARLRAGASVPARASPPRPTALALAARRRAERARQSLSRAS